MWHVASILFGLIVGSFLNVCIYRIPRRESILFPGSHCPHCQGAIRFYDNIPLVSYLLLRGRCRHCHGPISVQYPLVEGLSGFGSFLLFSRFGMSWEYFFYFPFVASLIVITVIDLFHQIIPDGISLPGIGMGLIASLFLPQITFLSSLTGMLFGGGSLFLVATVYHWLFKREGMGGGDIKLLAMIGAFLGWKAVIVTIILGSLVGSVIGVVVMALKGKDLKYAIPFGPFLSLGAAISLFYGEDLIRCYLSMNR